MAEHSLEKYEIVKRCLASRLDEFEKCILTDGGAETEFIYHHHADLPHFAAFVLVDGESGWEMMKEYHRQYFSLAAQWNVGFIAETLGWRASSRWGAMLGKSQDEMKVVNCRLVDEVKEVAEEFKGAVPLVLVSGAIGPRDDGYVVGNKMSYHEAEDYHSHQICTYKSRGVDMVTAFTLNYVEEAIGIVRSAQTNEVPVVISFTVETDGVLPSGQLLKAAITEVDLVTSDGPLYYMINCAHPSHILPALAAEVGEPWVKRVRAIRGNASTKSHAELDQMTSLDEGDVEAFGRECAEIHSRLPHLKVLGGCCGTDIRHIEAVCRHCFKP